MTFPAMSVAEAHARLTAPGSPFETEEIGIRGARMRVWKNAPATTRALLAIARDHGKRTFLVLDDERVSFDAFHRATAAFARVLVEAGLRKGDRVAIAMRNLPEWAVAFFAASTAGAIVTPLNAWWTTVELDYALFDSGATFAVVDGERLQRIQAGGAASGLRQIYVARAERDVRGATRLEEIIGPPAAWPALPDDDLPEVELAAEDDATIFYTSGTNGQPKGALGSHRNILSNIVAAASAAARVHLRRGEAVPAPVAEPQAGALLTVPLFHVTGCLAILAPCLYAGSKLVLTRRWDAERAIFLIAQERLSWWIGVPAMVLQLIEHPSRAHFDLSCLVSLGYGGSAAAPELARRIAEVLPAATAGHGWGMTETSGLATTHSAEDYALRPGSCGPPVAVGEVKIVRPGTDEPLAPGEIGELWYRGPQVVKGYWRDPAATSAAFVAGWVRTGDLARMDAEGFVYIVDRIKDVVIRGGENIYCVEVENALVEHPAVLEAALVGRPHRILGEEPVAFVTLKPDTSATDLELRVFLQSRLAAFKVPARFEVRTEPLPRNPGGKILKADLRQALAREGGDIVEFRRQDYYDHHNKLENGRTGMETAPMAEGLFEVVDGVPHLIGGRRRSDGRMVFPCPGGPEGQLYDRVRLSSEGVLWSFTVQRFRPKEPYAGADDEESFQPFALGYVELPGEVIVEGRFEVSDFSTLHIGQAMRLTLTPFHKAGGETVLAYAFEPMASRDAA